jgi:hypothetical protein
VKKKKEFKKLSLSRETLRELELPKVTGGYCSNSTLSAQVSLCVPNGAPVRLPECGPVD